MANPNRTVAKFRQSGGRLTQDRLEADARALATWAAEKADFAAQFKDWQSFFCWAETVQPSEAASVAMTLMRTMPTCENWPLSKVCAMVVALEKR